MKYEDIERIVRHASRHGINHLKLTGGEPLLRDDILKIISMISPLVDDLSMTTNGAHLKDLALDLKKAGLSRINVSLHSLNSETYYRITGVNDLDKVKEGIERAVEVGLNPVKVNMTILRGYNEQEIKEMMKFAAVTGSILQLIELQEMPGDNQDFSKLHVDLSSIESELAEIAIQIKQHPRNGRFEYLVPLDDGHEVAVEIVRPMHNSEFCKGCTRLRVTSDGKLKPCLLRSDNLVEISNDEEFQTDYELLDRAFSKAVKNREPYWRDEYQE